MTTIFSLSLVNDKCHPHERISKLDRLSDPIQSVFVLSQSPIYTMAISYTSFPKIISFPKIDNKGKKVIPFGLMSPRKLFCITTN